MKFDSLLLVLTTAASICFCFYAVKSLWKIGKREKIYCLGVFVFTLLFLVIGWHFAIRQGLFTATY